jgi:hypothetical protein
MEDNKSNLSVSIKIYPDGYTGMDSDRVIRITACGSFMVSDLDEKNLSKEQIEATKSILDAALGVLSNAS